MKRVTMPHNENERIEPVMEHGGKETPVPPEVQAYAPKKPDPALAAFDKELGKVQADLNLAASSEPKPEPSPDYPFVKLAISVADGMVQAAELAVTEAQSILEKTKAHRDKLRFEVEAANKEIGELTARLKAFGTSVYAAHQTFHSNGDDKKDSR